MNIKTILTAAAVACSGALWAAEACKGPECPNVVKLDLSTVQSWDPNEMRGPDGVGANRYVLAGDWMDYTIYFENKAEATAAAQEVFVTLPKDPSLDWDTLELGEVAFGANIDSGLTGKANGESTYYLAGSDGQVRTKVTVTDTEVKWYLRSWDPSTIDNFPADATAGFLPPNDATGRGEGHVRYRVRVKSSAAMATRITASATIVFDANEPITTDPAWWNTVAAKLPAEFGQSAVQVVETNSIVLKVSGGNFLNPASVVLDVAYQTATAADLDLKGVKVDGVAVKGFKFPYTLNWATDEIGEKSVEIPVKADKTVEADEMLTFTLANAAGQELGERHVCTVTIVDTNEKTLKASVKPAKGADLPVRSVSVERSNARGGFVAGTGEYASGSKLTLAAEARPGWEFRGWSVNGEIVSTKTKQQVDVTNDVRYVAVFSRIPYVRGLADPADAGKVTGSGYVASGKKVTLKATAAKNCTFAGWYAAKADDPNAVDESALVATTASLVIDRSAKPAKSSKTTTVLTDIDGDVTYFAVFTSSPVVTLAVDSSDGNAVAGKVTGAGRYAVKGKVTLKATAAKGYVFMGWYEGEALVSNAASYTFNMTAKDVFYVARFITATEDKAAIAATVNGVAFDAVHTSEPAETTCGVYLEWPIAPAALSATTVKVAGLPSGLKFTAKDILKKGSKTEVEIPANTIYGAPTAASKTDKQGMAKPSQVKVTVTTAGKNAQTFVIPLTVRALPSWAVGTFNGWSAYNGEGSGTLTVSAAGKLSGKTIVKVGTKSVTTSYSATYFTAFEDGVLTAVLTFKSGKETLTETVCLSAYDCGDAELGQVREADEAQPIALELVQNPWLRKDKEVTPPAFPKAGIACDLTGAFEGVKLTVKAKGAVTASGTLAGAKFSASAQLLLAAGDGTDACVILNGQRVDLKLSVAEGVITAVVPQ